MQELKFDIKIIKGLNLNNLIPAPLFKFIVEEQFKVITNKQNNYNVATIKKILLEEEIQISDKQALQAVGSLLYIIRFALNREWPDTKVAIFFRQNTLLNPDYQKYILERYKNQIANKEQKIRTLTLGRLINVQWSIINCLKDLQGNSLNKIYVKLELTTQNTKAETKIQRFILSLSEFKAFMEEFKNINSNINSK